MESPFPEEVEHILETLESYEGSLQNIIDSDLKNLESFLLEDSSQVEEDNSVHCSARCLSGCKKCKCVKANKLCTFECGCSNCQNTLESKILK